MDAQDLELAVIVLILWFRTIFKDREEKSAYYHVLNEMQLNEIENSTSSRSSSLKISFQVNNFIRNNITRSLIIFGINKIEVSSCLSSNISALLSKSCFQSKTCRNNRGLHLFFVIVNSDHFL